MKYVLYAADFYLVGLGFTVALVVYHSFHLVGPDQWMSFHNAEMKRIAVAVGPAWLLQGVATLWWLASRHHIALALVHAVAATLAVIVTLTKAVPLHHRLERHSDHLDIRELERWHWVRTAAWVVCALVGIAAF